MMFRSWSLYPQYTPLAHCADNRIVMTALHLSPLAIQAYKMLQYTEQVDMTGHQMNERRQFQPSKHN